MSSTFYDRGTLGQALSSTQVPPGAVVSVDHTGRINVRPNKLLDLHFRLCDEARDIMQAKNHDYTSGSGDPFANFRGAEFLGIHPVLGMQLRQQDKMMRVKTFIEKGQLKVSNETIKDAVLDQINYLVLQYAFITQEDNNVEPSKAPRC